MMNENNRHSQTYTFSSAMDKALKEVEKFGENTYEIKAYQNGKCIVRYNKIGYLPSDKWELLGIDHAGHPAYQLKHSRIHTVQWIARSIR